MKPSPSKSTPAILLVKTSSMGDVVHLLPAVSDIARLLPHASVDWLVEEQFADLPRLHPAIARVIPLAMRRWRRDALAGDVRRGFAAFRQKLSQRRYDIIIDAQGLVKSACIARFASGEHVGPGFGFAREPMAALFYSRRLAVPWSLPAIVANRRLVATALGLPDPSASPIDYGIKAGPPATDWLPATPYAILLHSASSDKKLWPERDWAELGAFLFERGLRSVFLAGNEAERLRADRLGRAIPGAVIAPALSLQTAASIVAGARLAVGVDSGLTHLAAALGTPAIAIFGGSNPDRTGVTAMPGHFARNLGAAGHPPALTSVVANALQALA